jgi:hypothetical protein
LGRKKKKKLKGNLKMKPCRERIELANPKAGQNVENQAGEQSLLPHERDETSRRQGTSLGNEDERSRAVMGQAAEDTKRGLKDTDRCGISSDIIGSDVGGSDAPKNGARKRNDGVAIGAQGHSSNLSFFGNRASQIHTTR